MVEAIDPALLRSIGEVFTILGFASMSSLKLRLCES